MIQRNIWHQNMKALPWSWKREWFETLCISLCIGLIDLDTRVNREKEVNREKKKGMWERSSCLLMAWAQVVLPSPCGGFLLEQRKKREPKLMEITNWTKQIEPLFILWSFFFLNFDLLQILDYNLCGPQIIW